MEAESLRIEKETEALRIRKEKEAAEEHVRLAELNRIKEEKVAATLAEKHRVQEELKQ